MAGQLPSQGKTRQNARTKSESILLRHSIFFILRIIYVVIMEKKKRGKNIESKYDWLKKLAYNQCTTNQFIVNHSIFVSVRVHTISDSLLALLLIIVSYPVKF